MVFDNIFTLIYRQFNCIEDLCLHIIIRFIISKYFDEIKLGFNLNHETEVNSNYFNFSPNYCFIEHFF